MIWLQYDVDLGPRPRDAVGEVFTRLQPAFDTRPLGIWFVRKPPGLRLRTRGDIGKGDPVADILAGLRHDDVVAKVSEVVYEPEVRRFGGERAMELVHDFFHVDSRAFAAWFRQREHGRLAAAVVSLGVVSTLFDRLLAGAASEVWDAWANLAAIHGIDHRSPTTTPLPITTVAELRTIAANREADALAEYDEGCRVLADGIAALRRDGGLHVGLRAFAADVALFHWNRYGLRPRERVALSEGALCALDPHRRLPFP